MRCDMGRRTLFKSLPAAAIGGWVLTSSASTQESSDDNSVSRVAFNFRDFGGNNNLEVNGDRREVDSLGELSGRTVGNAEVRITTTQSDSDDSESTAIITGSIESFSVGGQEFVLDSLELGPPDDPRASVEFDSVTPEQSSYEVGDGFRADDVSFRIDSYIYPDGEETDSGSGRITGGSDPAFSTGNANLRVDIGSVPGGGGDVSLSLTLTDDTAVAGGEAVIEFVLTNEGSTEATRLQGFINPPADAWTFKEPPGSFTSLASGESETIPVRYEVPADAAGEYEFGGLVEDDAGNEARDTATVVVGGADLTIQGDTTSPGGGLTVEMELSNAGSTELTEPGIRFDDQLRAFSTGFEGLELVEIDADGGTVNRADTADGEAVVGLSWPNLAAGTSVTPTLTVAAAEDAPTGEYTISAAAGVDLTTLATDTATVVVTDDPPLTLESVRPVQTVENSYVDDPSVDENIEDPPMVPGRPTSVLFKLASQRPGGVDPDQQFELTVSTDAGTEAVTTLSGDSAIELAYDPPLKDPPRVDEVAAVAGLPVEERPPIFDLPADVDSLTVALAPAANSVEGDEVELTAGSDFEIAERTSFRVGFIELRAPQDSNGYAYGLRGRLVPAYRKPGTPRSEPVELLDGPRERFEQVVDDCERYLQRVYPVTELTVERHPTTVQGISRDGWLPDVFTDYIMQDTRAAHDELVREFGDLDATVVVAPDNYFDYHEYGAVGVEIGLSGNAQPQTAACVEADSNHGRTAVIAAHEIGHHLEGQEAYTRPLAQRRGGFGSNRDRSHARTEGITNDSDKIVDKHALRSTGFDLWDGTFTVVREGTTEGFWGEGRKSPDSGQREWAVGSFMSYSPDDVWTDARIFRRMIEDDLGPTPPVEADDDGGTEDRVLTGSAALNDEGAVQIGATTVRPGRPAPDDSDGAVTVALNAPDGSTIEATRTNDSLVVYEFGGEKRVLEGTFTFSVPYPETTATVAFEHETEETTTVVNPTETSLRTAVLLIPDRGLVGDAASSRSALLDAVDDVRAAMDNNEYMTAADRLRELRDGLGETVREYDAAANQPTRTDLETRIDEQLARLSTLDEADGSSGNGGLPGWLPVIGAGLGAYRYLTGSGDDD